MKRTLIRVSMQRLSAQPRMLFAEQYRFPKAMAEPAQPPAAEQNLYNAFVRNELNAGVGLTNDPKVNMRIVAQRWNEMNGNQGRAGATNPKPPRAKKRAA